MTKAIFFSLLISFAIPLQACAAQDCDDGLAFYDQGRYEKAAEIFQPLAETGLDCAEAYMAGMYAEGLGVEQDLAKAAALFRDMAEKGDYNAQMTMGEYYALGRGVEQSDEKALRWFRMVGEDPSLHHLVEEILDAARVTGKVPPTSEEAVIALERAARDGNVEIGYKYCKYFTGDRGWGDKARFWCHYAARRGHADAQYRYAVVKHHATPSFYKRDRKGFWKGIALPVPDYPVAAAYYQRAADQGHVKAMAKLALMYAAGLGVARDDKKAAAFAKKAAAADDDEGLAYLGLLTAKGRGVERDDAEGFRLLLRAARMGNTLARCSVAHMLVTERGAAWDSLEQRKWAFLVDPGGDGAVSLDEYGNLPFEPCADTVARVVNGNPEEDAALLRKVLEYLEGPNNLSKGRKR